MFLQRLAQYVFRLRHGAFIGIYQQQHAVHHGKHPLHFPPEVRMARRVKNVDFRPLMHNGSVFGQDRNAAFPFQIVGIHHAFRHLFVLTENMALFQHCVYQSGFAMIDMGDDGNVPDIISDHS